MARSTVSIVDVADRASSAPVSGCTSATPSSGGSIHAPSTKSRCGGSTSVPLTSDAVQVPLALPVGDRTHEGVPLVVGERVIVLEHIAAEGLGGELAVDEGVRCFDQRRRQARFPSDVSVTGARWPWIEMGLETVG